MIFPFGSVTGVFFLMRKLVELACWPAFVLRQYIERIEGEFSPHKPSALGVNANSYQHTEKYLPIYNVVERMVLVLFTLQ
jgi:hypothetical protein